MCVLGQILLIEYKSSSHGFVRASGGCPEPPPRDQLCSRLVAKEAVVLRLRLPRFRFQARQCSRWQRRSSTKGSHCYR